MYVGACVYVHTHFYVLRGMRVGIENVLVHICVYTHARNTYIYILGLPVDVWYKELVSQLLCSGFNTTAGHLG